jgi:hypothetical protein
MKFVSDLRLVGFLRALRIYFGETRLFDFPHITILKQLSSILFLFRQYKYSYFCLAILQHRRVPLRDCIALVNTPLSCLSCDLLIIIFEREKKQPHFHTYINDIHALHMDIWGRRGRDCMVVGFTNVCC